MQEAVQQIANGSHDHCLRLFRYLKRVGIPTPVAAKRQYLFRRWLTAVLPMPIVPPVKYNVFMYSPSNIAFLLFCDFAKAVPVTYSAPVSSLSSGILSGYFSSVRMSYKYLLSRIISSRISCQFAFFLKNTLKIRKFMNAPITGDVPFVGN